MPLPNSTTLILDPACYTVNIWVIDNLASEFCGSALEATNAEKSDQIEVLFEGAAHKANSEAFLHAMTCFIRG